jgi:hypothetical protein
MPISLPLEYDKLTKENVKGNSLGPEISCCHCGSKGSLIYTGYYVSRNVVWADDNGNATHELISIPIGKSLCCKKRFRVLPGGVLPYKVFSLPLIEKAFYYYTHLEISLRCATEKLSGNTQPHYSTIWRWLKGMGQRVHDRDNLSSKRYHIPHTSSLIEESARRINSSIRKIWLIIPKISSWKWKSERRREELEACAKLVNSAKYLFPESLNPLLQWQHILMPSFNVAPWYFLTSKAVTSFQLCNVSGNSAVCSADSKIGNYQKLGRETNAKPP